MPTLPHLVPHRPTAGAACTPVARPAQAAPAFAPVQPLARADSAAHSAPPAPLQGVGTVERQAAIENALQAALHYLRKPGDHAMHLHVATARATRAASLLKQACEDAALQARATFAQRGV